MATSRTGRVDPDSTPRGVLSTWVVGGLALVAGAAAALFVQRRARSRSARADASESALRAANERHRLTLRSIGDAVIATDGTGRVEWLNPVAASMTGWTEDEAKGQPLSAVFRVVDQVTRTPLEDPAARVLREGTTVGLPPRSLLLSRDGREFPIVDSSAPIRLDDESIAGVVLVFRDHSAERQSEQALRDSEQLLRESQEVAGVGSYVLDVARGEWSSSAVLDAVFGIGPEASRSIAGWTALTHPDDRDEMARYFAEEVIGRRQRFDREYRIVRAVDGVERWVHGVGRLEFGADGTPTRMIGTIRDITPQKEAEFEHARLQEQLLQAQKMESVGRLAGGVAHDFNNMLGAILGYAELALDEPDIPEGVRRDLTEIQLTAERSAALTSQLLAFARRQTIAPRAIDLNATIDHMLGMLQRLLGEDVELLWRPGADLWPVKLDPGQVTQILANLCVNARDAIETVGHIAVETGHASIDPSYCETHPGFLPGEYVRLAVSDNGHGMDRRVLDHLFEPYFTTKPLGEGTGLGLATVYGIVKQNDGFINVYSEPGNGTTFTIYIPRHRGDLAPHDTLPTEPESMTGHGTILLVEDESALLRATAMRLVGLGYEVLVASSPNEALHLVDAYEGTIDLVLTDVVMPEMHGAALVARLRARRPGLPCLYMSGYTADTIAHRGVLDEGVEFIQKPFSVGELGAKVQHVLRAARA